MSRFGDVGNLDRSRQRKNPALNSNHFGYVTFLSTRDMARLATSHCVMEPGQERLGRSGHHSVQQISHYPLWRDGRSLLARRHNRTLGLRHSLVGLGSTQVSRRHHARHSDRVSSTEAQRNPHQTVISTEAEKPAVVLCPHPTNVGVPHLSLLRPRKLSFIAASSR